MRREGCSLQNADGLSAVILRYHRILVFVYGVKKQLKIRLRWQFKKEGTILIFETFQLSSPLRILFNLRLTDPLESRIQYFLVYKQNSRC